MEIFRLILYISYHYKNLPMQYTKILSKAKIKYLIFFNNIAPNLDYGFTLKPPHLGGFEFNHNLFFGQK